MQALTSDQLVKKEDALIFIYSRFCGTCHVARSFLDKIELTHNLEIFYEINASLNPEFLQNYMIERVPCLLIIQNKKVKEKIYTFYSIGNIYSYLLEYKPELFQQS